jgi:tetratricopeptide (TPR) repeat protein
MRASVISRLLLSAACFLLAADLARADDLAQKEAEVRFREGLALHDAGKDEEARLKFHQAYALHPTPAVLFNLARAEMIVGRYVEAANHFRSFIGLAPNPKITKEDLDLARGFAAQVDRNVARIVIEAPEDANVVIDGKPVDTREVAVTSGAHAVDILRGSVVLKHADVTSVVGKSETIRLDLGSASPPADGAPSAEPLASPPSHEDVPKGNAKLWVAAGLGVAAVASVGVGVGYAIGAGKAGDRAADAAARAPADCTGRSEPSCAELAQAADDRRSDTNLRTGFFIAGGVLGAGALLTVLLWPAPKRPSSAGIAIVPSVGGATFITSF